MRASLSVMASSSVTSPSYIRCIYVYTHVYLLDNLFLYIFIFLSSARRPPVRPPLLRPVHGGAATPAAPARVGGRAGGRRRAMSGGPVLEVRGLRRAIGDRTILTDISFAVRPGDVLFVRGPSGVGKSLLLRALAYLDPLQARLCRDIWPWYGAPDDLHFSREWQSGLSFNLQHG